MSDMNRDALNKLIQRFAISALSRERKNEALNEEILVGKYTGEFYIKTKDGLVISTDVQDRIISSTNNAIRIAEMSGMTGELYRVSFDDLMLPNFVDYTINFLNMEPIQIPNGSKSLLIYLDIDEFIINEDKTVKNVFDTNAIHIIINCLYDDGSMGVIELNSDIQNINYTKIDLSKFNDADKSIDSIFITNMYIDEKINLLTLEADDNQLIILHNIFVTVDR